MFQLILVAAVLLGVYVLLVQTLFKRSKCKGNASMCGKTVIITGGNTGIGKATALHLARKGAKVILACRNKDKAATAIAEIQKETGSTEVFYMHLDLASLKSVRSFANTFLKNEPRLDMLINNAGLVADGRTEDGYGIEFGVNHLGHFLLTCLLLERMKKTGGARVITLASMAYRWGHIDFERLCPPPPAGVVQTELSRNVSLWQKIFIQPVAWLLFLDPETGAQTTLHCALQEGIEPLSGRYFSCCAVENVYAHARDDSVALKLWEVSESLCGLS
uniref:Dehydrogenase/reductase (SDR family) member 13a, tandem duplicate 2 n=1 Tax=Amphilophus citrinellus TaxID=61819 RepID=A0A3Q0S1C2_AMPCI